MLICFCLFVWFVLLLFFFVVVILFVFVFWRINFSKVLDIPYRQSLEAWVYFLHEHSKIIINISEALSPALVV